jgi:2-oxoisovalerate dehydrogenase E1 component
MKSANDINWTAVAHCVLTSRTIDEFEESELVPSGKIKYQFSSKGHELAQVLLGSALNHPHDGANVYYRSRPFMLAMGLTPEEALAADMARTGTPNEGRDVGVIYSLKSRGRALVMPNAADVGSQYTPTAGWAQAITYHRDVLGDESWRGAIAVVLGGDGSVAANGFWAALTIATTQNLPMLFCIEDNGYGISVPDHFQTPGGDIAKNLASFGQLKVISGSGTQPAETAKLVQEAVDYVRGEQGACLLRLEVPRLTGHTYGEDQSAYKPADRIAREQASDPVPILRDYLADTLDWTALEDEVSTAVQTAYLAADQHAVPDPSTVLEHLFAAPQELPTSTSPPAQGPRINMVDAIRTVLDTELAANPKLLIFGEDIGPRGGVHRATVGLQGKHGAGRVFDTSLSEEGIIGRAVGMAAAGLRPVAEIQFRKYADPAYEQIHNLGWLRWRTAGKFEAPVVIRIPVGHSKKTGDPWHGDSGEAIYAHLPGLMIALPSNAADAAGLLRTALRGRDPVIFLEHRALYDTPEGRQPYPGDGFMLPFGKAARVQKGHSLTVVSWGEMLHRCIAAAEPFGDEVEILDLRTIAPWDQEAVMRSVAKTGKLMVAHEDNRTNGFAGEIIATVAEQAFTDLDAPIARIASADLPIPYGGELLPAVIPGIEVIRARMEALLGW